MYITGQRVRINELGHKLYGTEITNPEGVLGTVLEGDKFSDGWFDVDWDNGEFNSYEAGTLDVVDGGIA